ncbi:hypothetical protein Acr_24g0005740 [Actinidia rufa]|uniref:Uncharacterized protein n=1 Tax=Actinidia rufa TaxID=165716 RepID=A0A7J0GV22_9ERIC|nr:hypothetical protein Acr_24g0005740 [Actinidia rufa]
MVQGISSIEHPVKSRARPLYDPSDPLSPEGHCAPYFGGLGYWTWTHPSGLRLIQMGWTQHRIPFRYDQGLPSTLLASAKDPLLVRAEPNLAQADSLPLGNILHLCIKRGYFPYNFVQYKSSSQPLTHWPKWVAEILANPTFSDRLRAISICCGFEVVDLVEVFTLVMVDIDMAVVEVLLCLDPRKKIMTTKEVEGRYEDNRLFSKFESSFPDEAFDRRLAIAQSHKEMKQFQLNG